MTKMTVGDIVDPTLTCYDTEQLLNWRLDQSNCCPHLIRMDGLTYIQHKWRNVEDFRFSDLDQTIIQWWL